MTELKTTKNGENKRSQGFCQKTDNKNIFNTQFILYVFWKYHNNEIEQKANKKGVFLKKSDPKFSSFFVFFRFSIFEKPNVVRATAIHSVFFLAT